MLTTLSFLYRQKVRSNDVLCYRARAADEGLDPACLLFYALIRAVIRYFVLWVRFAFARLLTWRSSRVLLHPLTHPHASVPTLDSKRHTKTHTLCRRCGNRAFHRQHKSTSCTSLCHRRPKKSIKHSTLTHIHSLRAVRLSLCQTPFVRMGIKGQAPKDDRDGSDAVPQGRVEAVQERVQVSACVYAGTRFDGARGHRENTVAKKRVRKTAEA